MLFWGSDNVKINEPTTHSILEMHSTFTSMSPLYVRTNTKDWPTLVDSCISVYASKLKPSSINVVNAVYSQEIFAQLKLIKYVVI